MQKNKKDKGIGYPDDDWFDKLELDEEDHTVHYTVNGKEKAVMFCFRAQNSNDMKALRADHQERNKQTGIIETDDDGVQDGMILTCVGRKLEKGKFIPITQQQLDKLKLHKKNGLHAALWLQAIRQSDANIDIGRIEHQKN